MFRSQASHPSHRLYPNDSSALLPADGSAQIPNVHAELKKKSWTYTVCVPSNHAPRFKIVMGGSHQSAKAVMSRPLDTHGAGWLKSKLMAACFWEISSHIFVTLSSMKPVGQVWRHMLITGFRTSGKSHIQFPFHSDESAKQRVHDIDASHARHYASHGMHTPPST
jgi:hypothetical protein